MKRRRNQRAANLKHRYGVTEDWFAAKLEEQWGECAICHHPCPGGRLCVDHDHSTDRVRGLLCRACNGVLAKVENRQWLEAAQAYVAFYKQARTPEVDNEPICTSP